MHEQGEFCLDPPSQTNLNFHHQFNDMVLLKTVDSLNLRFKKSCENSMIDITSHAVFSQNRSCKFEKLFMI